MASLADRLAGLSPEQLALLSRRAREARREPRADRIEPRADRSAAPPLSFAQERLWFLDQIEGHRGTYNMPHAARLSGPLDVGALGRALRAVVGRHEVLRTTYREGDAGPVQRIGPTPPRLLPVAALGALPSELRAREISRLATAEARRPFDLARGPVLRALLLRLGRQEHVLLLTVHHIAGDGWSMGVLLGELAALYGAALTGAPAALPPLPIQYADFAVWQRARLDGERLAREVDYWRRRLGDPSAVLELPADRPRPAVQTFRGAHLRAGIGPDLRARLEALARDRGATLFMLLLAAFQALLHRYTGQDDLRVGTPLAGRTRVETERLVGLFINTLVLRARLDGDPRFTEHLERVRETVLEADDHQDLPFEKLVEALQPRRDLAHPPLFQVLFNLEKERRGGAAPTLPGLELRPVEQGFGIAKLDLTLALVDDGERLGGALEYNVDLFDRTTALRMERHYRALLRSIAAAPGARLSELEMLAPAERHQVTAEWPGPPAAAPDLPGGPLLHGAFLAWAERAPDAVAAVSAGRTLTYGGLRARSRELGRRLTGLGVGSGTAVAVRLERGIEALVAVLGVLEAGGVYVPVDPEHPRERQETILRDSGARWAIGREPGAGGAEGGLTVRPTAVAGGRDGEPAAPAAGRSGGEALAYVLYTSGSTGRPKGVEVPHRAASRFLAAMARRPGLACEDVLVAVTTLSFDISVLELFLPLSVGARVEIAEPAEARDPERLAARLAAARATACQATPATWHMLLDAGWSAAAPLRVLCGGEALPAPLAGALTVGGAELWNLYGPTETTVWSALRRVAGDEAPVPIGRPIAGTWMRVLSPAARPQPLAVAGELAIGGAGLARGYRDRPGLTAERFGPDPEAGAGAAPGERVYRTGDLARWTAGGELEYLGRIDTQVKVRGFRVELGEVETVLAAHPAVARAVVEPAGRGGGEGRLVAFVVPAPAAAVDPEELRAHAARSLPAYMVPSAFSAVDRLPLTPNGKVDRGALRALAGGATLLRRQRVPPSTPAEEMVAAVWSEVLGVPEVGASDDFFELGGHSLAATRVMARLRRRLGVEVPLLALFEHPTVAGLAARLESALRGGSPAEPPLGPAAPHAGPAPLSPAQHRLWLSEELAPGNPAYVLPFAVEVPGPVDAAALRRAVAALVRRHETLRTRIVGGGEEPVQVVDPPGCPPVPVVDLERLGRDARREVRRLVAAESARPFDLARGPLFRLALVRTAAARVVLGSIHHVVSDAASMEVLQRELMALYRAETAGGDAALPELPVQYGDWARWQRARLRGEVLERQVAYWRRRLAGAPATLPLPADRPRSRDSQAAEVRFLLPPGILPGLARCGRRGGATLFMTLLAAFQALLARLTGEDDVVVGIPVSQRSRPELEGLIGFFVNTVAARTAVAAETPFLEVLGAVRTGVLEAYAHQDLPFERVLEELGLERAPGEDPLVQVLFALERRSGGAVAAGEAGRETLVVGQAAAKVDWTLSLVETPHGLAGGLEYRAARFDRATAVRAVRQLRSLVEAVAADPDRRVGELPLLGAGERHQLRVEWGRGPSVDPEPPSIHGRFLERAAERPDAVAVVRGAESLTYGELARRSASLAAALRDLGAGPDRTVALLLEPSPAMVVSLLAVLRAGAAYLALDPGYPDARLATMSDDARPVATIADRRAARRLPEADAPRLDPAAGGSAAPLPALPGAGPGAAAYVVYTSGSTGVPRGIVVPHRAVLRLVGAPDYVELRPDERILQASNLSFDAAIFEVWGALLSGACLVLPEERRSLLEPAALAEVLRRERVGTLFLTTSLFHQVARSRPSAFAAAGQLLVGGEAADPEAVRRVLAAGAPGRLVNAYGPSESTTFAVCGPVREVVPGALSVPIGRPIAGTRLSVVDRHLRRVPPGVAGELLLGGAGLARGYLGRPAATAERFVPDPRAEAPGERLYRTGDLVRQLPDGAVDFLRRIDAQVKVRGFRVEPGEVEAALVAHPGVAEAVVLAPAEAGGERHLVACYAGPAPRPEPAVLREFLRGRLPAFMVPAAWVSLDALPLNANGKVDRRALEALAPVRAGASAEAPRTPFEEVVAAVWSEVLGAGAPGAADDFFELGGHSLSAGRVAARLSAAFGIEVPLREVFESPVLSELARRVEERLRSADGPVRPPLVPHAGGAAGERTAPLSFAQRRLWFLHRLHSGDAAYNVPAAVPLRGPLDAAALARALGRLARRHEVLRTRIEERPGAEPVQVIDPPAPVPVPVVDLSALATAAREAEARRLAVAEAFRPFDLARGPVFRTLVLRTGLAPAPAHLLLLCLHHVAGDGWSMELLEDELLACYRAAVAGREPELPDLPVRYADYAAWQRSWLRGDVLEAEVAWWRERLGGAADLDLPADRPPRPLPGSRGAAVEIRLPAPLARDLEALGRGEAATLFMVLLAGFQALLARISGQDDVVVGTPVANRDRLETEGIVGCFVNTLALRTREVTRGSFRDLLARVREAALGAYAHQDLPFEVLVERLDPERDLARSPLFQVMFQLERRRSRDGGPAAPAEPATPAGGLPVPVKFPWTLVMTERTDGVSASLQYRAERFDAATVRRALGQLRVLLAAAVADPDRPVPELPLLEPAQEHQVRLGWNDTAWRPEPVGRLHDLVLRQAAAAPARVAVASRHRALTYGALARRSAALAASLRRRGLGPEATAGVFLERSVELPVALLAVLEAGAAYVPLDPDYPEERLRAMADDADCRLIVTDRSLAGRVPPGREVVLVDGEDAAGGAARPSAPEAGPGNAAYVLFTSGSTGRAKGVVVPHEAIVHHMQWMDRRFPLEPGDRTLHKTPLSFDASVAELFAPLLSGAALVMAAPGEHRDPPALARAVVELGITVLQVTPSLLAPLLEQPALTAGGPLRRLYCGGEALAPELRDRALDRLGCPVVNLYGPCEATIHTAARAYLPAEAGGPVALGRPIDGVRAWVADARLHAAPPGVPGELVTAGAHLSRGYAGRPAATAERFVPDPWSPVPGGRLYRTGDLAVARVDGELQYLGRIDHQVKVRGVRIELGEIESVLRDCPGVVEAVVVQRPDAPGGPGLVAYVVPVARGGGAEESDLRETLRRRLPESMMPAAFVRLDALPATPGGKVDRRALPPPRPAPAGEPEEESSWDLVEHGLRRIWTDLLGVESVGRTQSFFDLGGHSLLAVRLVSEIERRLGARLALTTIFQRPTLAQLAETVRSGTGGGAATPLVELEPGSGGRPFFCVHAVGGSVLAYRDLAVALSRRFSPAPAVYGLQSVEGEEGEGLATVEAMAERYLDELRSVQPQGPYRLVGWSMGGAVAFEMACRLEAAGESVELLVLVDALAPGLLAGEGDEVGEEALWAGLARDLARQAGRPAPRPLDGPGADDPLDRLRAWGEAEGIFPPGTGRGVVEGLYRTYGRNRRAWRRYRAGELAGRAFLAVSEGTVRAAAAGPALGWEPFAPALTTATLPADHYSILRPPAVEGVADSIAACLGATASSPAAARVAAAAAQTLPMETLLFIVGCPRSGTTWALDVFKQVPGVVTIGEAALLDCLREPWWVRLAEPGARRRPRPGRWAARQAVRLLERTPLFPTPSWYPEWKETLERYFGDPWTFLLNHARIWRRRSVWFELRVRLVTYRDFLRAIDRAEAELPGASHEDKVARVVAEVFGRFYRAAGGQAGGVLVEKTPSHLFHADFLARRFPQARFVEMVRDGRDVCVSMDAYRRWMPQERKAQILEWATYGRAGLDLRRDPDLAARTLTVRYEDLKRDPVVEIARMLAHAGLPAEPEAAAEIARATHISRVASRGEGRHYRKGVVGDWRSRFSAEDEALFRELAGDVFRDLGYEW